MGNFFGKAVLTAFAVIGVFSVGCTVFGYGYGGVLGNTGNILEDEEVPKETTAAAETEPVIPETDNNKDKQVEAPLSPWDSTIKDDTDALDSSDNKQTSENKLSPSKKKKAEKIVDNTDSKYSYEDMREDIDKLIAAYSGLVRARS